MNRSIIIVIIVISFIFYCCSRSEKLKNILIGDGSIFWDVKTDSSANYCFWFGESGECKYYYYDKRGKRYHYDDEDQILPNTWAINDSNKFLLRGYEFRILKYNSDSIWLYNKKKEKGVLLVKH